jgi:hypothetical protein
MASAVSVRTAKEEVLRVQDAERVQPWGWKMEELL